MALPHCQRSGLRAMDARRHRGVAAGFAEYPFPSTVAVQTRSFRAK
jgi:hypothetical protein